MIARLRRWLAEPLVGFALLALLLLGAHSWLKGERPLEASDAQISSLVRDFERRQARAPTEEERAGLVQSWIDDELLYREGLALGLHDPDPIVRRRVIQKVRLLHRSMGAQEQPTNAELLTFRDHRPEQYRLPPALAFEHAFVADRDLVRAQAVLAQLEAGADPTRLGDPFARGQREPVRSIGAIDRAFGEAMGTALQRQGDGWALVESAFGLHLARVTERVASRMPDVSEIRQTLVFDYQAARADQREAEALQDLRAGR